MRRLAITAVTVLALASLAGAAHAIIGVAKSKAVVKLRSCSLEDHSAVFYGRMRKLAGTRRMQMRFALLERGADGRFRRVRAPALAHWRKSKEGVRSFGYRQVVRGLKDGAAYRMRVRFRWYDADHELLRSVRRTSRTCRMYVRLPNLTVRILDAQPAGGVWRYRVRVTNVGKAAADDVSVRLTIDGSVVRTETISHLDPGEARRAGFYGPACKHDFVAAVDPDGAISETSESDNTATGACAVPLN
jgi:hypothetical protein